MLMVFNGPNKELPTRWRHRIETSRITAGDWVDGTFADTLADNNDARQCADGLE